MLNGLMRNFCDVCLILAGVAMLVLSVVTAVVLVWVGNI